MFEKSGTLGGLHYEVSGPTRFDPGEVFRIGVHVENPTEFPRWIRISALEGKGGEWLQNKGIGLADLAPGDRKDLQVDLGRFPETAREGEYILRVNLSTLGGTEYFSYPVRVGPWIPWWGWAAAALAVAMVVHRIVKKRKSASAIQRTVSK